MLSLCCCSGCDTAASGKNLYTNGGFVKAENSQKLMAETVMVCEMLEADRQEGQIIRAAVPNEMVSELRQYDADIYLPYEDGIMSIRKSKS